MRTDLTVRENINKNLAWNFYDDSIHIDDEVHDLIYDISRIYTDDSNCEIVHNSICEIIYNNKTKNKELLRNLFLENRKEILELSKDFYTLPFYVAMLNHLDIDVTCNEKELLNKTINEVEDYGYSSEESKLSYLSYLKYAIENNVKFIFDEVYIFEYKEDDKYVDEYGNRRLFAQ